MSLHKEISFELEICEHLASKGWLHTEGDAARAIHLAPQRLPFGGERNSTDRR